MEKYQRILCLIAIGLMAAIIDTLPMYLASLEKESIISAFAHWMIMPFIIPFLPWPIWPPLKGIIASELLATPVMILVAANDPTSVIPIMIMSAILGAIVCVIGKKFAY